MDATEETTPAGPVSARVIVGVVAGVIPGKPEPEFGRRWAISSAEWEAATSSTDPMALSVLLADVNGRALAYAGLLMLQPDRLNWVQTEWCYL